MKILFLDIDGVLNHERTEERLNGLLGIDRNLLRRFHKMMKAMPGVDIVISSSWRRHSDLMAEIDKAGIRYIGYTPYLWDTEHKTKLTRGMEVDDWIERRPHLKVERFAIVDDDSDMLDGQTLFQTSCKKGLTGKIAYDIVKYFNE